MSSPLASPNMQTTRQEKTSGFLSATLLLLGVLTLFMLAAWLSQQRNYTRTVTRLSLRAPQDQGSGSSGAAETFRLLDGEQTEDLPQEMVDAAESLRLVSSLATTELAALEQSGGPKGIGYGQDEGDGRKKGPGLGSGDVVPNWQRWQIRYAAADIQEYAAILDFFGVELGIIGGGGPTIDYARNLSQGTPLKRTGKSAGENRLRFIFERGELKEADRALAQKAGYSVEGRVVCQFFPDRVKSQLQLLEREAIGSRPLSSVKHTVFGIRTGASGLEFFVLGVEPPRASSGLAPL